MQNLSKNYMFSNVLDICEFSWEEFSKIDYHLSNYQDLKNYRYLFSSREWLSSYLYIYKTERNFLVPLSSCSTQSDTIFTILDGRVVFTGFPFNDFNVISNLGLSGVTAIRNCIS